YEIDATDIIQEIVDRGGWNSGNAITMVLTDRGTTATGAYASVYDYANDPTRAAKLTIVRSTATPSYYDGVIDEVKLYGTDISRDQVLLDMNAGSAASFGVLGTSEKEQDLDAAGDPPVFIWKFDENTGTTANNT